MMNRRSQKVGGCDAGRGLQSFLSRRLMILHTAYARGESSITPATSATKSSHSPERLVVRVACMSSTSPPSSAISRGSSQRREV